MGEVTEQGPNCFVFRTSSHPFVQDELKQGRLRQGWSPEGTSLLDNNGQERTREDWARAYKKAWSEEPSPRRHGILRRMLDMQVGDVVLCPKAPAYGQFTIAKVSEPYRFEEDGDQGDFGHIIAVENRHEVSDWYSPDSRMICGLYSSAYSRPAVTKVQESKKVAVLEAVERLLAQADASTSQDPDTIREEMHHEGRREAAKSLMQYVNNHWGHHEFEAAVGQAFLRKGYERLGGNIFTPIGGDADHVFSLPMPGFEEIDSGSPVLIVQVKHKQGRDDNDVEGVEQLVNWKPGRDSEQAQWEVRYRVLFSSADSFTDNCWRRAERCGVILICGVEAGLFIL